MELTKVEQYLFNVSPNYDETLRKMEAYAENTNFPIVGPIVGNVLGFYARLIGARRIFELGSGFGYSALWFALSTAEDAQIICTDLSKDNYERALLHFEQAGVIDKIEFKIQDALDALREVSDKQDIIFNDIEKRDYPKAFELALEKLRIGGLLITDNTLWHGKVLSNKHEDESTLGVLRYNELAFSDERVHSILIPLRDGITVSVKISD